MIKSYQDLRVWNLSMELVEMIYHLTEKFPAKEKYRLVDQLCRAVVSVPSNIAEGSKRHTTREYARFVGIAQGSLAEVETQLLIAKRLVYINENEFTATETVTNEIGKLLGGLFSALERKANQSPLPLTPTLALTQ